MSRHCYDFRWSHIGFPTKKLTSYFISVEHSLNIYYHAKSPGRYISEAVQYHIFGICLQKISWHFIDSNSGKVPMTFSHWWETCRVEVVFLFHSSLSNHNCCIKIIALEISGPCRPRV